MRVHLLGSSSAEGWPAAFCRCPGCQQARRRGGRSLRTRSSALVDGSIQFDWPSDTYAQALHHGVDLSQVRHVVFTHTHADHFYPRELALGLPPYVNEPTTVEVWGDAWAIDSVRDAMGANAREDQLHVLTPRVTYRIEDARLTPLPAAHYPERGSFNYVFQRARKTLFYGLDSGWYPEDHWQAQNAFSFDLAILDCTGGPKPAGPYHGDIETVVRIKTRMLTAGVATAATRFVATHFAHDGGWLHEELVAALMPHGIDVAYDGMVIDV